MIVVGWLLKKVLLLGLDGEPMSMVNRPALHDPTRILPVNHSSVSTIAPPPPRVRVPSAIFLNVPCFLSPPSSASSLPFLFFFSGL
jgi:hypothetical protein